MAIGIIRNHGGGGSSKPSRIYFIQNGEILIPYRPLRNTITVGKSGNYATFTGAYNVTSDIEFETTGIDTAKYTRLVCVAHMNTSGSNSGVTLSVGGGTAVPNQTTDQTYAVSVGQKVPDEKVQLYIYSSAPSIYIKDLYFEDDGSGQQLNYIKFNDIGDKGSTRSWGERTWTETQALPKVSDRYYELTCINKWWHNSVIALSFLDDNDEVITTTSYPYNQTSSSQNGQRVTLNGSIPSGAVKIKITYYEYYGNSWIEKVYFKTNYNSIL